MKRIAFKHQSDNSQKIPKLELVDLEIPYQIAKEIKFEKLKQVKIILLNLLLIAMATISLVQFFTRFLKIWNKWIIHPVITIPILIISSIALFLALINFKHLFLDVQRYKNEILANKPATPLFLINISKNLVKKPYYINWFCFGVYLYGLLAIGIYSLYLLFVFKHLKTSNTLGIWIGFGVLGTTALFQIISLLLIKHRLGNINAIFGKELISLEEIKQLKKTANRRSIIVFFIILAITLTFIFIFFLFFKIERRKVSLLSIFKKKTKFS